MIVSNNNYSHTSKKVEELLTYLDKEKDTLLTMISSLEKLNSYPEMNGEPPVKESLRAKVAELDIKLISHPVPPMTTTTYSPPAAKKRIWDDLPQSITTTTVPIPVIPTVTSY